MKGGVIIKVNERIKLLRTELLPVRTNKKYSIREFAECIKVTEGVIKNIEYDLTEVKGYIIALICKTFMVSEKWLMYGEEPIFIEENAQIIDNLCVQYNFGKIERVLLEQFIQLDSDDRKSIVKYMTNCVENLSNVKITVEKETEKLTLKEIEEIQRMAREKPQAFLAAMSGGVVDVKPNLDLETIMKHFKQ